MAIVAETVEANGNFKIIERRKALIEKFRKSTKSPKTAYAWQFFLHRFMRDFLCCQPIYEAPTDSKEDKKKFRRIRGQPMEYFYELLIDFFTPEQLQEMLEHFVSDLREPHHKGTKKVRARSIENYIAAIEHFLWINKKKGIDWDMVRSFKGEHVRAIEDREYYDDETRKGLAATDERGRVVIRLQRQTGVRRGAEPVLNVEDIEIFALEGIGRLAKLIVYRGTEDQYPTYGHPEFVDELEGYYALRLRHGEVCRQFGTDHYHKSVLFKAENRHLDPKAPVIREEWNKKDELQAKNPKEIEDSRISQIVDDAMVNGGVRLPKLPEGQDRHEVMSTHGLRKAFKKKCRQAKVDPIILEYLMGHKKGNPQEGITRLMMIYDPPDEQELLTEYLKAIDNLSLNESQKLKKELKVKEEQLAKTAPKDLVADLMMQNKAMTDRNDATQKRLEKVESDNQKLMEFVTAVMQGKAKVDPNRQASQT